MEIEQLEKRYGKSIYVQVRKHARTLYTVDGVMHPRGLLPIKFKSLDRLRRHCDNVFRKN